MGRVLSYILIGLAALAALGTAGAMIFEGLKLQHLYQVEATKSSNQAADRGRIQMQRECAPLATPAKEKCENEIGDTYRAYRHDTRDLEAQRTSAIWTAFMGAAALLGMAVSIIGVILVYITFNATRQANVIARESAEEQVRAWLTIKAEPEGFQVLKGKGPKFAAKVKIENVGHSPALAISYWMSMAFGENPKEHLDAAVKEYAQPEHGDWLEGSLFPHGEPLIRPCTCEHDGERPEGDIAKVSLYVLVAYRTAQSDKPRITAHIYDVIDTNRGDWTINFKDLPSGPRVRLRTNKTFAGYAT